MRVSELTLEQKPGLGGLCDQIGFTQTEENSGGQGNDSWSDAERLDSRFLIDRMDSSFFYVAPSLLTLGLLNNAPVLVS